jgi:hypothetical protein
MENVDIFLELLKKEQTETLIRQYPDWFKNNLPAPDVRSINGKKYTKIDVSSCGQWSGKYMIDNATGDIFGIKGYGVIHKGHKYGNLNSVNNYYWGDYVAVRKY